MLLSLVDDDDAMLTATSPKASVRDSVLIFLKSESFAQSLQKILETSGYRSMAVTTESLAMTEAKTNVPSLIILDVHSSSDGAAANSQVQRNTGLGCVETGGID